jgi:sulfur-oxidizing protein SoxY
MEGFSRRDAMRAVGAGMLVFLVPPAAFAADADTAAAIRELYGEREFRPGRVTLELPPLAETGNSVPVTLSVDSPMTDRDRVLRASLFASRNPRPLVVTTLFGPRSGAPAFTTNIRLNGTQDVIGIAEMSDHSVWRTQVRVMVTVGACDALETRY